MTPRFIVVHPDRHVVRAIFTNEQQAQNYCLHNGLFYTPMTEATEHINVGDLLPEHGKRDVSEQFE